MFFFLQVLRLLPFSYDDLKPPTSPTPSASDSKRGRSDIAQAVPEPVVVNEIEAPQITSAITETKSAPLKVHEAKPLSPYFV